MKLVTSFSVLAVLAVVYLATVNTVPSIDASISQIQVIHDFAFWTKQFNKNYPTLNEKTYRFSIFRMNHLKINKHNSNHLKTYEMGINQFSDLTEEEFQATHLTLIPQKNSQIRIEKQYQSNAKLVSADSQINWVEKGFVTSVKNEGQCGACWAFAALGPLQAMIKQQGKPLVSLSAQQVMDCSSNYGNQGCNGGLMDNAYSYIKDSGVTTEDLYPYVGAFQKCLAYGGEYKIKGFVDLKDCNTVASSLMKIPIAVAVDASKFYTYKSGVFTDCSTKPMLNHAFALVGMTSEYWLGKEQWGVKWGDNGYIKIARNGSACGICQIASYPV